MQDRGTIRSAVLLAMFGLTTFVVPTGTADPGDGTSGSFEAIKTVCAKAGATEVICASSTAIATGVSGGVWMAGSFRAWTDLPSAPVFAVAMSNWLGPGDCAGFGYCYGGYNGETIPAGPDTLLTHTVSTTGCVGVVVQNIEVPALCVGPATAAAWDTPN